MATTFSPGSPTSCSAPIVAVLPPATPAPSGQLTTAPLADMPLITAPPGTSTRTLLDQALRRHQLAANIVIEASHREAIVPLVLAGTGPPGRRPLAPRDSGLLSGARKDTGWRGGPYP
jgi:DNA-binding transcriptional LysR family regulator